MARLLPLLLAGCTASAPLEVRWATSPLEEAPAHDFASNLPYDVHERTRLDVYRPRGAGPFPLVVFVHGGGFVEGSEDKLLDKGTYVADLLEQGVAVAGVAYRLLDTNDADGILKPMGDVTRAIQFLRHHAATLDLDPTRFAGDGGSAGAGTLVWIATQPDAAEDRARDPVARASSVLQVVNANEVQATYDLVRWENDIFDDYGVTLDGIAALGFEDYLASFLGAEGVASFHDPEVEAYRDAVDMLDLVHPGMPPLRIENAREEDVHPLLGGRAGLLHHPRHGRMLFEAAVAAGADVVARVPELDLDTTDGTSRTAWLTQQLAALP